jgi:hypothetical protein
MTYVALVVAPATGSDLRNAPGRVVNFSALIRDTDASVSEVEVSDISTDGCRFRSGAPLEAATAVWLKIPGIGARHCRIIWQRGEEHGCEFTYPMQEQALQELSAARVRSLKERCALNFARLGSGCR